MGSRQDRHRNHANAGHACRSDRRCAIGNPAAECRPAEGQRPRERPLTATEKHGQHRQVREPLFGHAVRRVGSRLPERQPVLDANTPPFSALHATNASRQVSGASSPMSAASTATLRTAAIRAMDTEPSSRASRAPSHAFTVALVKPDSGSSPNHSMAFAERQVVHPSCNWGRSAVQH